MGARRILLWSAAVATAGLVALVAWDMLKLSGRTPQPGAADERATAILVEKGARRLTLLRGDQPVRSYAVSLGRAPTGHKQQEGDARTPEGRYAIDFKNARSRFHLVAAGVVSQRRGACRCAAAAGCRRAATS